MSTRLLECQGLSKSFDGLEALTGFNCSVEEGEILGLIGPNGAGKTTLFNLLTGFLTADSGSIRFRGREIHGLRPFQTARLGIGRMFQRVRLIRQLSVIENVLVSFPAQPGEHLGSLFFRWRLCAGRERSSSAFAEKLLNDVGLCDKANDRADELSYGQQKLLALACALAMDAELYLMDEPIAGIAPEMVKKILSAVRKLPESGKSVILIEHDLDAVAKVCERVIVLDAGSKVAEGPFDEIRQDPDVIEAYLE